MEIYESLDDVPADFGPSAVTIGKFDGVHQGHLRIIERLREAARESSLVSAILTFDRNPLGVLAPEKCPIELVSNRQRLALLGASGVDCTVMLPFTRAFSQITPRDFVTEMLVKTLHARRVMVGGDFRFGSRGAGDVSLLKELGPELGFSVDVLPTAEYEGRRISSTWVRELLSAGDIRTATRVLGREPVVRARVVKGAQRGRALGFPTANLAPDAEGYVPADGVYAAWAVVDGQRFRAAVSIGNNPTFDGVAARQVEAHLLGAGANSVDLDLYGKLLELHFVERLREMVRFDDLPALVAGITADTRRVRELLPDRNASDE